MKSIPLYTILSSLIETTPPPSPIVATIGEGGMVLLSIKGRGRPYIFLELHGVAYEYI